MSLVSLTCLGGPPYVSSLRLEPGPSDMRFDGQEVAIAYQLLKEASLRLSIPALVFGLGC